MKIIYPNGVVVEGKPKELIPLINKKHTNRSNPQEQPTNSALFKRPRKSWTPEEDTLVKAQVTDYKSAKLLTGQLGRSAIAIHMRKQRLNGKYI